MSNAALGSVGGGKGEGFLFLIPTSLNLRVRSNWPMRCGDPAINSI